MNYALILAGGIGLRLGNPKTPKQFVSLCGKPIIMYSMDGAQRNDNIDAICVVCTENWRESILRWCKTYNITKKLIFADAGENRQQSVHNGLKALNAEALDIVMIMTAVCPFVCQETINKNFAAMNSYLACITVVNATDAITFSNNGKAVNRTLQKSKMFVQQGPQIFQYGILKMGHEIYESDENRIEVNEDSEMVLNMGIPVGMVRGDRFCIKVTYPEDLAIAEALKPIFEKKEGYGKQNE